MNRTEEAVLISCSSLWIQHTEKYPVYWGLQSTYYQILKIKTTKDIIKAPWKRPINLVLDEPKTHLMWALISGAQASAFSSDLASWPRCATTLYPSFAQARPKEEQEPGGFRGQRLPSQVTRCARSSRTGSNTSWRNEGTKVVGTGGHKHECPICAGAVNATQGIWGPRK